MELDLRACDGITVCALPNVSCQRSATETRCTNPLHGLFQDLVWRNDTDQRSGVTKFHTDTERFKSLLFLSRTVLISLGHGFLVPH